MTKNNMKRERTLVLTAGTVNDSLAEFLIDDPESIFYSMDGLVASVLRTGRLVAKGCGNTEIHIHQGPDIYIVPVEVINDCGVHSPFPVLISRNNGLLKSYRPENLVRVPKGTWAYAKKADIYLCRDCMEAYNHMAEDAALQGIIMRITSGYRSYTDQLLAVEKQIQRIGYKKAMELAAPAGFSEHQLGLALDVGGWIDGRGVQVTTNEAVYHWIEDNCWRFGFMLKNPKGKEHITGGIYEPWHIRYIGDLTITQYIHDKAITLNEYLENI